MLAPERAGPSRSIPGPRDPSLALPPGRPVPARLFGYNHLNLYSGPVKPATKALVPWKPGAGAPPEPPKPE